LGLTNVLQALGRLPTLTKLVLNHARLGPDDARQLGILLCNTPSLHTLVLKDCTLRSAELVELAPALYHNTSIKELDLSENNLHGMESAEALRDVIRRNKTMTTLDLSGICFGQYTVAVERIADGLGSNSTLLKINLSRCALRDDGVSILAQNLGSRNTMLHKLALTNNSITSIGAGVLFNTVEHNSHHITDLDLQRNPIGGDGASFLARALGNNTLPNLTRLSLIAILMRMGS
jgi:Ran GTPase-activating protein (RanGAP) involved in mRNA processing and transport